MYGNLTSTKELNLLGIVKQAGTGFAPALLGGTDAPDSLEDVAKAEGHTESLDDVLALSNVRRTIWGTGVGDVDGVVGA